MEVRNKKAGLVCAALLALVPTIAQEDTSPPALIEFWFSPTSVDVTAGPANVKFTAHITDALSGVAGWALAVTSPSGTQGAGGYYWAPPVSGDPNDGVFEETIVLPQYAEAGTWKVVYVHLMDKVGNALMLSTDQLAALNFPTTLTVTSTPDTSPPLLAQFGFSPTTVNTSSGPASVKFTAHITDALSGVAGWALAVTSPSGTQGAGGYYWAPPVSGDPNDGVFEETIVLPQYAEAGTWGVVYVCLIDKVGNDLMLVTDQLVALGFPTELVNGPQIIPVQIDIKPGSFPNSINLGSQGAVPVAILSTPTFDAREVDPLSITLASAAVALKGKGTPMASFQHVNQDGLLDLVVHVDTQALQLTVGDTVAILEGQTFDGRRIRGSDTVRVVP